MYLAIDPGSAKCGLALVDPAGRLVRQETLPIRSVLESVSCYLEQYRPDRIILGRGTGYQKWRLELARISGREPILVEEKDSTLLARRLYWQDHPRRGWRRLLPLSLLAPPEPYDGYAAAVLARRWLAAVVVKTGQN